MTGKKKAGWVLLDILFIAAGLLISVGFYFSLSVSSVRVTQMCRTLPLLIVTTIAALWVSGIYKSLLRYAGADTFLQIAVATLIGTGVTYLISLVVSLCCRGYEDQIGSRILLLPRPIYFIQWVITLALIAGSRFLVRYRTAGQRKKGEEEKRILVIGAGYAGATVIRDIQNGR